MAISRVYNLGELQLRVSPFLQKDGSLLRSLNVERDSIGAWKKRKGYITYLGTPDNGTVNSLFSFHKDNGTQLFTYRQSGSILYHSVQGTGAWTTSANGTITPNNPIHFGIDKDTLFIGQEGGTTRHTTNGTGFTDTSLAPTEVLGFAEYKQRMWAIGTGSLATYATEGTPTDWSSDSASIYVSGAGQLSSVFKAQDRLVFTKNSGLMYRYDGFNITDMATENGPSSPYSIANVEDFRIYMNRMGAFGYGGGKPELISNPIQRQIYNNGS